MPTNYQNQVFQLSLATTPEQIDQIAEINKRYGVGMPADARSDTQSPYPRPATVISPGDQVIVVTDPTSKTVVGSVRLNLVFNGPEVNQELNAIFPWEDFPVMVVKEPSGSEDILLRYVSLQLANMMDIPLQVVGGKSIGSVPIRAQIGELTGTTALAKFDMNLMRPVLRPKYVGQPIDSDPSPGNVIPKREFRDAIEALVNEGLPRHIWLGELAFEQFFDPNLVDRVKNALTQM